MRLSHTFGNLHTRQRHLYGHSTNINKLKLGIQIDRLRKTLTDAVLVCRQLIIQYLWADALFIIQNLSSDVQNEISHMDQVYRHVEFAVAVSQSLIYESALPVVIDFRNSISNN